MTTLVAGVDTSTQSCKVLVRDCVSGQILRQGQAFHPEGTEVHPDAWWQAFLEAVSQVGGLSDISALAVGGQQHGMVCLNAEGEVIRPALLWNDTRSAQAATQLITDLGQGDEEKGRQDWAQAVGSVPVAALTITKLRWLADNEPHNAEKIAAICLPHDWLTWKISGAKQLSDLVTDRSDASGTGYVDIHGEYRRDLLALALRKSVAQIEHIQLPQILQPFAVAGRGDTGQGWDHIILGPGCGDNAGAALGLDVKPGEASLSLGTSGVIAAVSDTPIMDPSGMVTGFMDATGRWLPLACTLNGARSLDVIRDLFGVDHAEFDRLALAAPAGAGGLTLTPYYEGERTPNLPDATASLVGMTLENVSRECLARASVEGLLQLMRGALNAVRAQGVPINRVNLIGGGAKSGAVQQLSAGILDMEVIVPPIAEYVALGAAKQAERVYKELHGSFS